MLLTWFLAVLCAYGAVMAGWAVFGRWLGFPLTAAKPDWLGQVYKGVSDDGRDIRGRHTGGRLRE
ncbi:MAG: hypothetical protein FWG31_04055 [Oscillospiraceae bacterium]|nr:hypothetical protein [Oscillospiraceae bacterium]